MSFNLPIIYYHSVAPKKNINWARDFLTLDLKYFETHLQWFKENGYKSISLNDYYVFNNNISDNDKKFLLTFDDGYVDNWIYVFPLLKKYGFKATIFVNSDYVDKRRVVRKTLDNYWNKNSSFDELNTWGFLTWDEMRLMEKSGLIDIQSHTLTHTKYFVSDTLIGFHHPGADCLYPVGNLFPERLPYYIGDQSFEKLLPYGFPFFEEQSSIIARKVIINPSFIHDVVDELKTNNWNGSYNFPSLFTTIKPIYEAYKKSNSLIQRIESEQEYKKRVYDELKLSKEIIEKELNKKVEFCCWPHGDNNEFAHKTALELGYKATTLGKMPLKYLDNSRFTRFGLGHVRDSIFLTNLKTRYKVGSLRKEQPYAWIQQIYEFFRDRI